MARFRDRREAGRELAVALAGHGRLDPVVLALPRGGVPVAFEVAKALAAQLDVVLVRKIGAPGQEEFGIGAVADGVEPLVVLDAALVRHVGAGPDYIAAETRRQLAEMRRRRACYVGERPLLPVEGRTVILIDDGVATGGTARAALRAVRQRGAARIVFAVPVAAAEALARLRSEADELVCLHAPAGMGAVGEFYARFEATSDQEVIALLADAASDSGSRAGP